MSNETKLILVGIAVVVLVVLNLIAYLSMGADKKKAKQQVRRTPEKTLFLHAILFGGIGATMGMFHFHHKTKHWYFRVFFPLFAIVQSALVLWGLWALFAL